MDAEIARLDAEYLAKRYQRQRTNDVSERMLGFQTVIQKFTEQLDQLYRDINAGKFGSDAKTGEWFVGITSVKNHIP